MVQMCCGNTDGWALPGQTFAELEARNLELGAREYQETLLREVRCEPNLEGYIQPQY